MENQGDSNEYPQHMFLWTSKQNYPLIIIIYPSYLFMTKSVEPVDTAALGAVTLTYFVVPQITCLFIEHSFVQLIGTNASFNELSFNHELLSEAEMFFFFFIFFFFIS